MIHKVESFSGECDNCRCDFEHWHEGWTLFLDSDTIQQEMDNQDWYTGDTDPDHEGKHYCPDCFKQHPDIDDKIIVDESRKKEPPTTNTKQ